MLGIYTRLSKEDEESNSISNQKREGVAFATKHNFDYKLFDEGQGLSGGLSIEDRPQLLELTNAIKEGVITSVWFRDQNRLERDSGTFTDFVKIIKGSSCDVYYSDEKIDYSKASVVFQGTIYSAFSQLVKDMQGEKTKKALKDNAKEGKTHGISAYGYTKDSNSYIIIESKEAEVVKRIFEMSLEGKGTNKIAEIFNDEGIPTRYNEMKGSIIFKDKVTNEVTKSFKKKDVKWAGNTIRSIIKNTIYKGERHLKSGVYKVTPKIVEPHYWQQVNDNLKANRNNSGKVVTHKYLLKGIIKCHKCGRNYYGRTRVNKKDNYYMCSSKRYKDQNCGNRSINIDVIENFIWQRFFVEMELLKITETFFKDTNAENKLTDIRAEIKLIEAELIDNDKKRKRAINLVLLDGIDDSDVASAIRELKNNKNDLEIKLKNKIDDENYYLNIDLNKENDINNLKDIKETASFNKKRDIIQKYISMVEVGYHVEGQIYALNFTYNNINSEMVYFIDRNYNVAYAINKFRYIFPISEKAKNLNLKELFKFAYNTLSTIKTYDKDGKEEKYGI
jgi:DNA invertase Pin-like site-specific DNA recombinase